MTALQALRPPPSREQVPRACRSIFGTAPLSSTALLRLQVNISTTFLQPTATGPSGRLAVRPAVAESRRAPVPHRHPRVEASLALAIRSRPATPLRARRLQTLRAALVRSFPRAQRILRLVRSFPRTQRVPRLALTSQLRRRQHHLRSSKRLPSSASLSLWWLTFKSIIQLSCCHCRVSQLHLKCTHSAPVLLANKLHTTPRYFPFSLPSLHALDPSRFFQAGMLGALVPRFKQLAKVGHRDDAKSGRRILFGNYWLFTNQQRAWRCPHSIDSI